MKNKIWGVIILLSQLSLAQNTVPAVYTNILFNTDSCFVVKTDSQLIYENKTAALYSLSDLIGNPKGTKDGFTFNFNKKSLNGTLYYGFLDFNNSKYRQAVYFKRYSEIEKGVAQINMTNLSGKYDMVGWQESHKGTLAYRVVNNEGNILYDGRLSFIKKEYFEIATTVIEGPMLSILTDSSVTIHYKTNNKVIGKIQVNNTLFKDSTITYNHEIFISNLEANKKYKYEILCEQDTLLFSFKTAPKKGSRTSFTFAYASDSRGGQGGGERNIYGVNAYILKKSLALALQQKTSFIQFTGDLINGYSPNTSTLQLEYANFKQVASPFAAYTPLYVGIGNHEIAERFFPVQNSYGIHIDRFPFKSESMEAIFANEFTHPKNGPISEDGESYDPNYEQIDFPPYKENVYYYVYDNIVMIVLNSEYLYAPSLYFYPEISGGLHGYLMDAQLKWLKNILLHFEKDNDIDYIFITQHTPIFPNGGHTKDAKWYNGNNSYRSIIAGKKLKNGIIEQRDKYLDLILNKSSKVIAVLTGDEHNYCKTYINDAMPIYPENWNKTKLKLNRSIYQINNGACGAPYYAQEKTPWTKYTSGFSTQNALVLFDVNGKKVKVRVLNPDTLEEIENYDLK